MFLPKFFSPSNEPFQNKWFFIGPASSHSNTLAFLEFVPAYNAFLPILPSYVRPFFRRGPCPFRLVSGIPQGIPRNLVAQAGQTTPLPSPLVWGHGKNIGPRIPSSPLSGPLSKGVYRPSCTYNGTPPPRKTFLKMNITLSYVMPTKVFSTSSTGAPLPLVSHFVL